MRLGLRILDTESTLNNLKYIGCQSITPGDTATVLMQIVDLDTITNRNQLGHRYMAASGATLTATIANPNPNYIIYKIANQPFPLDDSIWQISFTATDTANCGSITMQLVLTEGSSIKNFLGNNVICINPGNPYQC
jgi:hypothetical protein